MINYKNYLYPFDGHSKNVNNLDIILIKNTSNNDVIIIVLTTSSKCGYSFHLSKLFVNCLVQHGCMLYMCSPNKPI